MWDFHWISSLGRFGLGVVMSVCIYLLFPILSQDSSWPGFWNYSSSPCQKRVHWRVFFLATFAQVHLGRWPNLPIPSWPRLNSCSLSLSYHSYQLKGKRVIQFLTNMTVALVFSTKKGNKFLVKKLNLNKFITILLPPPLEWRKLQIQIVLKIINLKCLVTTFFFGEGVEGCEVKYINIFLRALLGFSYIYI